MDVVWMKKLKEIGYPTPAQTLGFKTPDWSKKEVYAKEAFDYTYPPGERITADKIGLTPEECLKGVYLNLNHETPMNEKITPEKVISVGLGRTTKMRK